MEKKSNDLCNQKKSIQSKKWMRSFLAITFMLQAAHESAPEKKINMYSPADEKILLRDLGIACYYGRVDQVNRMITYFPNLNLNSDNFFITPPLISVIKSPISNFNNKYFIIQLLLNGGVDTEKKYQGNYPIHIALENDFSVVEVLLTRCDSNKKNKCGQTPVAFLLSRMAMLSKESGEYTTMKRLIHALIEKHGGYFEWGQHIFPEMLLATIGDSSLNHLMILAERNKQSKEETFYSFDDHTNFPMLDSPERRLSAVSPDSVHFLPMEQSKTIDESVTDLIHRIETHGLGLLPIPLECSDESKKSIYSPLGVRLMITEESHSA